DRTAAAGAFDQTNDRHAKPRGDLLRHFRLALDRGIRRAATQREVVAGDHDGPALQQAAAKYAVTRNERGDVAPLVIRGLAGDAADFMEAAGVQQAIDAFANRQPAALMLPRDAFRPTQFTGQRAPMAEFGEFRFPPDRRFSRRVDAVVHAYFVRMIG